MTIATRPCNGKSLDDIRDDFNYWYGLLWAPSYKQKRNWFKHTDQLLFCAFELTTPAPRPVVPDPPTPLVGVDLSTLGAELVQVSTVLRDYAEALYEYAVVVNHESREECQALTRDHLRELKRGTREISQVPALPPLPSLPEPPGPPAHALLCRRFTKWSERYYEWSMTLSMWERSLDLCLKARHPSCARDAARIADDAPISILQITPVPWPPWSGYEDEP